MNHDIEERLLAERYGVIARQMPQSALATLAMAALSLPFLWQEANRAKYLAAALLLLAWAGMFLTAWHYRRRPPQAAEARRSIDRLVALKSVQGSGWGVYAVASIPTASLEMQVLVTVMIFGVCAGSAIVNTPAFRAVMPFNLAATLPTIASFFFLGTANGFALAIGSIVGLVTTLIAARQWEGTIVSAMRTRFENLELVEELTVQKAVAEAANRQKSRFLAAASHDLRQPLHALNLFLEVARNTADRTERQAIYARVESAANSLTTLFDGLMELSRLEGGALEPQRQPMRLAPLLEKLGAEFRTEAQAKSLEFRLRSRDMVVETDPVLLEQILRNILTNAVRYTHTGGILLGVRRRRGAALIEVWDTGIGISAEQQPRIFEEFYQVGNPQRDRRNGVGLGLAIVNRAAALLDHPVEVSSTPGRGTRFRVTLPQATGTWPAQDLHESVIDIQAAIAGVTVGVIDDEGEVAAAVAGVLRLSGCIVYSAADCASLRRQLREADATPDVILSDYRLTGGQTGVDAIRELRAQYGADLPALIVSGDGSGLARADLGDLRVNVLRKPVPAALLRQQLAELLRN